MGTGTLVPLLDSRLLDPPWDRSVVVVVVASLKNFYVQNKTLLRPKYLCYVSIVSLKGLWEVGRRGLRS